MRNKQHNLGRVLISILIGMWLVAAPFVVAADEQVDYNEDYLKMKTIEEMYLTYNTRINDMFNDAIKKSLKNEGVVMVSQDDAKQDEDCANRENIAAICLGIRALYEYRGYEEAMTQSKDNPNIPLFKDQAKATGYNEAYSADGDKKNFIDREIVRALDSQDATMSFYTEFMGAQQMHKENEKLIEALAAYDEKLAELRTQTYSLPPKFHNVTTDGGGCV